MQSNPLPWNLDDRYEAGYTEGRHEYLITAADIQDNPYDPADAPLMRRGWTDGWIDAKDEANGW